MSSRIHRRVTLTRAEVRLACYLANVRARHHQKTRPDKITLYGSLDDYISNMKRSVGAEIAFCKAMNVYPCTEVVDRSNKDATLHDGRGVDVKSTANPHGPLIAKLKPHMDLTDLYAQVLTTEADKGVYTITGFIRARDAITPRYFRDVKDPYYAVPQAHLLSLEEVSGS
jgi:hypothetical protein